MEVFRECSLVPSLSSAAVVEVMGGMYEVVTRWTQKELERGKKVSFGKSFFVEREREGVRLMASSSSLVDTTRE